MMVDYAGWFGEEYGVMLWKKRRFYCLAKAVRLRHGKAARELAGVFCLWM